MLYLKAIYFCDRYIAIFPENLEINEKNAMDERGLAIQRHLKKRMEGKRKRERMERKNGASSSFFFFFKNAILLFITKKYLPILGGRVSYFG